MKVKRSIGMKRIAILCTIMLPIVFFVLGAAFDDSGVGIGEAFYCLSVVCLFLPFLTYKIGYWVADGFQRDKE